MSESEIPYGPVFVTEGPNSGRIGYYDDEGIESLEETDWEELSEDHDGDGELHVGYIYFGGFFLAQDYRAIPISSLREVTTDDLMKRREELHQICGWMHSQDTSIKKIPLRKKYDFLAELNYVESVLVDRLVEAKYMNTTQGSKVFISHSSQDKVFATWLGTDLKAAGHTPWFDEWDIRVGESIPQKISEGLLATDYVIVILSENAIRSRWVEREWHAKYWSEIETGQIQVLPILLRDCHIPELLKTKKYADFRTSYNNGLEDILLAIDALSKSCTA